MSTSQGTEELGRGTLACVAGMAEGTGALGTAPG
jgi:hypothetical protein